MKLFTLVIFSIMIGGAFVLNYSAENDNVVPETSQVLGLSTTESNDPLLRPINTFRKQYGVEPLQLSSELKNLTAYRSADMISRQYYSHKSPDSTTYENILDMYIDNSTVSCENLSLRPDQNINEVIISWAESSEHRDCLLNPNLNRGAVTTVYFDEVAYSSGKSAPNFITVFVGSN